MLVSHSHFEVQIHTDRSSSPLETRVPACPSLEQAHKYWEGISRGRCVSMILALIITQTLLGGCSVYPLLKDSWGIGSLLPRKVTFKCISVFTLFLVNCLYSLACLSDNHISHSPSAHILVSVLLSGEPKYSV